MKINHESPATSIQEAKECLGANNVFGPNEWLGFFPGIVHFQDAQLAEISEIPWPKSLLAQPTTIADAQLDEHFLFLGLSQVTSGAAPRNLNLFTWINICHGGFGTALDREISQEIRGGGGPKFNEPRILKDWFQTDWSTPRSIGSPRIHYTNITCEFRWYFMPTKVLGYSIGAPQVNQPCEYDIATAVETVTANILYYLLNRRYMPMVGQIARTCDNSLSHYGQSICVWSDRNALSVGTVTPGQYPGVALSRRSSHA